MPHSLPHSLVGLQSRTLPIAKATLYLLTSLGMVPSGKEALAAAAASSAILSTVAAYNKEQDFVFKTYAMECLQVECPQCACSIVCVHAQSCVACAGWEGGAVCFVLH